MVGPTPSTEKLSSTNITVKKSTAEVYTIRFTEHRDWWIQATLIEDRNYIALNTSHGDWTYTWGSPGMPFKKFLTTIDDGYLLNKLGGMRDFFNGEKSLKQIKKDVIERRHCRDITSEEAKEIWYHLKRRFDCSSEINYTRSMEDAPRILMDKIYDDDWTSIPFIKEHDPSLHTFVKNLWPSLVKILKDELECCDIPVVK